MQFAVYKIKLQPTSDCKRQEPYEWYVGSTYVDEIHGVEARIHDHRVGRKSNIVKRGYRVQYGVQLSCNSSRPEAEEVERKTAEEMRRKGLRVWQA